MHDYNSSVAGCAMVLGIVVASIYSNYAHARMRADQRMALIAQGKSVEEIERLVGTKEDEGKSFRDPLRSLANARRTGIVLVSLGTGLVVFFVMLRIIVGTRAILSGAAAGLLPLAMGIGFFIDYNLQKRELSRFGMEVDSDSL